MELSKRALCITPSMTLAISARANELKAAGKSIINFSVGEPDFRTPEYIISGAKEALDKGLTKYTPVGGMIGLKNAIKDKFKRDNGLDYNADEIVVSTGAKSSLFHALYAILNENDEVIIPKPYWLTYPEIVTLCGAKSVFAETKEENNYKLTAEELDSLIGDRTKCLILNSPNNPSGAVYTEEELKALAEVIVRRDIFVISDEVYEKLCFSGKHVSIASLGEEIKKRTIVVNAVSKTYAMTGWRIGYLACDKSLAKVIISVQSHTTSNATSFAQYGAMVALEGGNESVDKMVAVFGERRKIMTSLLSGVGGITFIEPQGAFYVFVNIGAFLGKKYNGTTIADSVGFAHAALEEGVALIPGKPFGNDNYVRMSYAVAEDDIREGISRFSAFLNKIGR